MQIEKDIQELTDLELIDVSLQMRSALQSAQIKSAQIEQEMRRRVDEKRKELRAAAEQSGTAAVNAAKESQKQR